MRCSRSEIPVQTLKVGWKTSYMATSSPSISLICASRKPDLVDLLITDFRACVQSPSAVESSKSSAELSPVLVPVRCASPPPYFPHLYGEGVSPSLLPVSLGSLWFLGTASHGSIHQRHAWLVCSPERYSLSPSRARASIDCGCLSVVLF